MNKWILSAALSAGAFLGAREASACPGEEKMQASIQPVTVEEVVALKAKSAQIYDANGIETRQKYGVIPGAKLLSHYVSFQSSELPKSKSDAVVFYCGSEACTAAPQAAKRAVHEGYTNVKVLTAGIKGWTKAGQPVVPLAQAASSKPAGQPGA
ncbi:MAG: rhodanese-like domain-containing protein [Deltaproteobacteria bacterium]|nr:rhodanese-like domain-containing protein [Deltaproteobacteria bacterium]